MSNATAWLFESIAGNTDIAALIPGGVHQDVAPDDTVYPFVVIQEIASPPVENAHADLIGDREHWIVKAYERGVSHTIVDTIDEKIRALLHKASAPGIIHCLAGMRRPQADKDRNDNPIRGVVRYYEIFTQE